MLDMTETCALLSGRRKICAQLQKVQLKCLLACKNTLRHHIHSQNGQSLVCYIHSRGMFILTDFPDVLSGEPLSLNSFLLSTTSACVSGNRENTSPSLIAPLSEILLLASDRERSTLFMRKPCQFTVKFTKRRKRKQEKWNNLMIFQVD